MISQPDTTRSIWHWLILGLIMILAITLRFAWLSQEGYGNLYYAAAVKSMLTSWPSFFFVSFDPAGFIMVDKPPLGLWLQAGSAALFGFSGVSLILPQALAGVLSVLLLYHIVYRSFGAKAALLSALILATTPISVAANRNNTMDSLLVLTSLLAAWTLIRAGEKGQLRWLLLAFSFVGLGFNIKMLQAFLVLPAFYLYYLVAPPIAWQRRLTHLAAGSLMLAFVSLLWVTIVDLTPADSRPFIGSSTNNSVTELIIGHNGLSRLIPGGLQGPTGLQLGGPPGQSQNGAVTARLRGFSPETGAAGPFRFFYRALAGQLSWFLPLAGLGLVAAYRFGSSAQRWMVLFWGAWLIPQLIFFSFASLFHRYYLGMMAPAIAVLGGVGLVMLWQQFQAREKWAWLLPVALLFTAAIEIYIVLPFSGWRIVLTPIIFGLTLLAVGGLLILRDLNMQKFAPIFIVMAGLGLLLAPLTWAAIPVWFGGDVALPFAGPDVLPRRPIPEADARLISYLQNEHQGETFLVGTINAQVAAPIMLATDQAVMTMGGFSGGDQILSADRLETLISQNEVRFLLLPDDEGRQADLVDSVKRECEVVPTELWQDSSPGDEAEARLLAGPPRVTLYHEGPMTLYDCDD